ncbi:ComEC/Rec2 family competence protein [Bengtsoniella intestinalis]|uniref:ComEC/Rec2 family competence protein n=1 Tax=Bengtsoniella intestinalis TaxID=3073143 RepID=UPI00391F66C2
MKRQKGLQLFLAIFMMLCCLVGCESTTDYVETPSPSVSLEVEQSTSSETATPSLETSTELPLENTTEPTTDSITEAYTETSTTLIAEDSTFEIIFLDVGQADAALVSCDGEYMLIDGGNVADSNLIYSVLDKRGITELSIVVGTHAHEDHIGGLSGALNYATADVILCPVTSYDSSAFENFAYYADLNGGITVPSVGDKYTLGNAEIIILAVNSDTDANNTSIVLKITYGETSFLFTGDAEYEAEQVLLNSGYDLSSTVLKVGHHGSDTSTSYVFLREIMPQYAVISCGEGNSYGHPTDAVLSRLWDADVTLYRTDLQGDIICTSNGQTVTFTTDKIISDDELLTAPSSSTATVSTVITDTSNTDVDGEILYVLNTSSHKFHYPDCYSVSTMSEKNYATSTEDRDTLISQGYSPCGNCNP